MPKACKQPAPDGMASAWSAVAGSGDATGKWSKSETQTLKDVLSSFATSKGVEMSAFFGEQLRTQKGLKGMWLEIHAQCRDAGLLRSVASCYHRAARSFVDRNIGPWTDAEENSLSALVTAHGKKWKQVSLAHGRTPEQCRDHWRVLEERCSARGGGGGGGGGASGGAAVAPSPSAVVAKGSNNAAVSGAARPGRAPFTQPERDELTSLVKRHYSGPPLSAEQWENEPPSESIPWVVVGAQHRTRGAKVCRDRWSLVVNAARRRATGNLAPAAMDAKLLAALYEEGAEDESDVNWSQIPGVVKDVAQRRWAAMKGKFPATDSFEEVLTKLMADKGVPMDKDSVGVGVGVGGGGGSGSGAAARTGSKRGRSEQSASLAPSAAGVGTTANAAPSASSSSASSSSASSSSSSSSSSSRSSSRSSSMSMNSSSAIPATAIAIAGGRHAKSIPVAPPPSEGASEDESAKSGDEEHGQGGAGSKRARSSAAGGGNRISLTPKDQKKAKKAKKAKKQEKKAKKAMKQAKKAAASHNQDDAYAFTAEA